MTASTPTTPLPMDAHTDSDRQGEPESIGEILPGVLAAPAPADRPG